MKELKSCKNCPFLRCNSWGMGVFGKLMALHELDKQQIFSCHMKHADENIFSIKPMVVNDCAGFHKMQVNMQKPNTYPEIVNCFNETSPIYDLNLLVEPNYKSKFLLVNESHYKSKYIKNKKTKSQK